MIRPIPESINTDDHPMLNELQSDPDDDEMFLNEDDAAEMKQSKRRKIEKMANQTKLNFASENVHVIYKRSVHTHEPDARHSDFGLN